MDGYSHVNQEFQSERSDVRSANHPPAGARETLRERHFSVLTWRVLFLAVVPITIPCLAIVTLSALQPVPDTLDVAESDAVKARLLSREGIPLSVTYQHDWNVHDRLDLHQIPELLRISMLYAEDQRFYQHTSIDWLARAHAFAQNLVVLRPLRGASTITEQVIRLLYPRPRTLWSRWLEGFEAQRLERRFSKSEIFEFYLNQVPYAANRRGVAQAARYFFDRSVDTLSLNEMFALAVMIRAPSRLDLWHDPDSIRTRVDILATRIRDAGVINQRQLDHVLVSTVELNRSFLEVDGVHFNRYVHMNLPEKVGKTVTTTLDAGLQVVAQDLLDRRLVDLTHRGVKNGAVLVVDHEHSAILAWCVARPSTDTPASDVNAVTVPRQPGSTLKPFVYAMALEKGWTAATSIEDAPLSESVGTGLHRYNNYSRLHYGPVSLREALASSLNIPAVKALQFVGQGAFLERLHRMGMESLTAHADQYGDGLALGNGEVSLLELVRAYTVLARGGLYAPLKAVADIHGPSRRVFSKPIASLVADILSDDQARGLEFGVGGVLDLPVQTAVKTGTSSDHRDVWAVGFNHRYTVGVWMGNLDRSPTD